MKRIDENYPLSSYVHCEMLREGVVAKILGLNLRKESEGESSQPPPPQPSSSSLSNHQDCRETCALRVGEGALRRILFVLGQFLSQVVLTEGVLSSGEGHLTEALSLKLENDIHHLCSTPVVEQASFVVPSLSISKLSSSLQILTLPHLSELGSFYQRLEISRDPHQTNHLTKEELRDLLLRRKEFSGLMIDSCLSSTSIPGIPTDWEIPSDPEEMDQIKSKKDVSFTQSPIQEGEDEEEDDVEEEEEEGLGEIVDSIGEMLLGYLPSTTHHSTSK